MGGGGDLVPLPVSADAAARSAHYAAVAERVDALLEGETDWVAAQATVACELHHAFECASPAQQRAASAAAEQGCGVPAACPHVHAQHGVPCSDAWERSLRAHARAHRGALRAGAKHG
jgi:hypothetical protein